MNIKFEYVEWPYLRSALLVFTGSAVLGASLLAGSALFKVRMERQHRHHTGRLDEISNRYEALDEEERIIEDYLPQYLELQKTGLLGGEHRLNWIETLQDAGDALGLPSLGYGISAQKPYAYGSHTHTGGFGVFASEMTLNMQLLHEGDLFALLDLLDERAKGLYTVSSCDLTRNFVELTDNPVAGNITAGCSLEWFSIKPVDGAEAGT